MNGKDGSPVRFRRGAPLKPQVRPGPALGLLHTKSRQPHLPENLPVRLVRSESDARSESGVSPVESFSKAYLAPVELTLLFVHGRSGWMQSAPELRLDRSCSRTGEDSWLPVAIAARQIDRLLSRRHDAAASPAKAAFVVAR